jgi:ABC-type multidrug transport system fused ATPase/permease subunit
MKRSLLSYVLHKELKTQLFLILLIAVSVGFKLVPLEMQKRIINQAIKFSRVDLLLHLCGLYILAVLVSSGMKYWINILRAQLGEKILRDLQCDLFGHIIKFPLSYFRKHSHGSINTALTGEINSVGEFFADALSVPAINLATYFAFVGYMFYLNATMAIVTIVLYPVEMIFVPRLQGRLNIWVDRRIQLTMSMGSAIQESLAGIEDIHANATYDFERFKFTQWAQNVYKAKMQVYRYKFLIKLIDNLFSYMGPFFLFLVGGYLVIRGTFDLGALVAFLSAYGQLYDPWRELITYYQDLGTNRVKFKMLMRYFDIKPEFQLEPVGRPVHRLKGMIRAENLSYIVEPDIHLLEDINLEVDPGEHLGVVGLSGSGKSTLAMVIGYLIPYHSGHILVDGLELADLTKKDISYNMGFVSQNPHVFQGTLADNLLYGLMRKTAQGNPSPSALLDTQWMEIAEKEDITRIMIDTLRQVALETDLFHFGLNSGIPIDFPDREKLQKGILQSRTIFSSKIRDHKPHFVDFFDTDRYLEYITVEENILFGETMLPEFQDGSLVYQPYFLKTLRFAGLEQDLLALGLEIARELLDIFGGVAEGKSFFLQFSPIKENEFPVYRQLVGTLERKSFNLTRLNKKECRLLLEVALRFVPGVHKVGQLSAESRDKILAARRSFQQNLPNKYQGDFHFLNLTSYMSSKSVLENLIFGKVVTIHNQAQAFVRDLATRIIHESGIYESILALGLEYQVGAGGGEPLRRAEAKDCYSKVPPEAPQHLDPG